MFFDFEKVLFICFMIIFFLFIGDVVIIFVYNNGNYDICMVEW